MKFLLKLTITVVAVGYVAAYIVNHVVAHATVAMNM